MNDLVDRIADRRTVLQSSERAEFDTALFVISALRLFGTETKWVPMNVKLSFSTLCDLKSDTLTAPFMVGFRPTSRGVNDLWADAIAYEFLSLDEDDISGKVVIDPEDAGRAMKKLEKAFNQPTGTAARAAQLTANRLLQSWMIK